MIEDDPFEEENKPLDTELLRRMMMGDVPSEQDETSRQENFSNAQQIPSATAVCDLHYPAICQELGVRPQLRNVSEILAFQLNHCEQTIERSLKNGFAKLLLIHGKGEGRLMREIHRLLDQHPSVSGFELARGAPHLGGATRVRFR